MGFKYGDLEVITPQDRYTQEECTVFCLKENNLKGEYVMENEIKNKNFELRVAEGEIVLEAEIKKNKIRGFEVVKDEHRKSKGAEIKLPIRGDRRSAGYDFTTPVDIVVPAHGDSELIFLDVKAYMQEDEVLELYVRSSIGIKKHLILKNTVGIIDSSYYSNPNNDGNIGVKFHNTSDKEVVIPAGERVVQGIFKKYLVIDEDNFMHEERIGGFGSSDRNN